MEGQKKKKTITEEVQTFIRGCCVHPVPRTYVATIPRVQSFGLLMTSHRVLLYVNIITGTCDDDGRQYCLSQKSPHSSSLYTHIQKKANYILPSVQPGVQQMHRTRSEQQMSVYTHTETRVSRQTSFSIFFSFGSLFDVECVSFHTM